VAKEWIAIRHLRGVDLEGSKIDIYLRLGRPYQCGDAEWACPVALEGLYASLRDQHGDDSWQALMLAQGLLLQLLAHFVAHGGQLAHAQSNETCDLDNLFSKGTYA
jgi:hypothetical protein